MTVLQKTAATGVEKKAYGIGSYLIVGLIAVAVGAGAVAGFNSLASGTNDAILQGRIEAGFAQRTAIAQLNLQNARIEAGLAQQSAIYQQQLLQSRIESGLAQSKAMTHEASLLQSRIESGLAQSQAMTQEATLLQSRIQSGLAQQQAIKSANAFREAWAMRGEEMTNHLDALVASGEATRNATR